MIRLLLVLAALLCPVAAIAQPVTVIGPITSGDCPSFSSTTVLKDAGFVCITGTSGHAIPFLDGTNVWSGVNNFGIGLTAGTNLALPGTSLLMINANTVAPPGFVGGGEYLLENFVAPNSDVGLTVMDTYGPPGSNNPNCCFGAWTFRRADGTSSAPAALKATDIIGTIDAHGYDGNTNTGQGGYVNGGAAQIRFNATENWAATGTTSTNNGASVNIFSTPNGFSAATTSNQVASFVANTTAAVSITVGVPGTALGVVGLTVGAFANLPTPIAGMVASINDGKASNCGDTTCTTWGTAVTGGGGALPLLIWYTGTAWHLTGK